MSALAFLHAWRQQLPRDMPDGAEDFKPSRRLQESWGVDAWEERDVSGRGTLAWKRGPWK